MPIVCSLVRDILHAPPDTTAGAQSLCMGKGTQDVGGHVSVCIWCPPGTQLCLDYISKKQHFLFHLIQSYYILFLLF